MEVDALFGISALLSLVNSGIFAKLYLWPQLRIIPSPFSRPSTRTTLGALLLRCDWRIRTEIRRLTPIQDGFR
jgi:hypothetical protein